MIRYRIGCVITMLDLISVSHNVVRVVDRRRGAGLLLNRRAGHADGGRDRVQRKRSHQEPYQQCREQAVHRFVQYSMTVFTL